MTQKTFHGQTATFISKLIASFPGDLNGAEMQKCIDDPKGLRDAVLAYVRPLATAPAAHRITFTVTGRGLTGVEWISRLETSGHKLSDWARTLLMKSDYDKSHRLVAGKEYKVSLVFGREIRKKLERKTVSVKALAAREIGEHSAIGLKGEHALLICEKFSSAELEAMGIWYIAVFHEPIIASDGSSGVLDSYRGDVESCVYAYYGEPDVQWDSDGAFAFLVR